MKATLEFTIPEEQDAFNTCVAAPEYRAVLHNFDQWLRGQVKHANLSAETLDAYQAVRSELWDVAQDYGVDL